MPTPDTGDYFFLRVKGDGWSSDPRRRHRAHPPAEPAQTRPNCRMHRQWETRLKRFYRQKKVILNRKTLRAVVCRAALIAVQILGVVIKGIQINCFGGTIWREK